VWYGLPLLEFVDASKIKAPLLAHRATQDGVPIASVDALEEKLRGAGVSYEGNRSNSHEDCLCLAKGPGSTGARPAWRRPPGDQGAGT
jgi:carboxymethylenebutenolidase